MRCWSRPLAVWGLLVILPVLAGGCFLKSVLSYMIVESISEEVDQLFAAFDTKADVAICSSEFGHVDCTYVFGGVTEASSVSLVSEFGILGVLIDPLIVQLPASFSVTNVSYDDGTGTKPLVVHGGLTSVPVEDGVALTPEPGQQLMVIELPDGLVSTLPTGDPSNGKELSFSLGLTAMIPRTTGPVSFPVKVMFALKVTAGGQTYYPPMLPCAASFADVPAIQIGESSMLADILPAVKAALGVSQTHGCNNKVYHFDRTAGTSTTTVPASSTSTTTLAGGETCGNCVDDDGDGFFDFEDPACCGTTPTPLTVRRARLAGTRVRLKAGASGLDVGSPPTARDVVVQLRPEAGGSPLCATLPADRVRAGRKGLDLRDPKGGIASAGGLSRVRLRVKPDGSTLLDVRGTRAQLGTPAAGPLHVTLALPAVGAGAQCSSGTVGLTQRRGSLRYP